MFNLRIETGNDSFAEDPGREVANILSKCARRVVGVSGGEYATGALHDSNGNHVGTWTFQVQP